MQTMRLKKAENFMKDARVLLHNERCDSCVSRCYYALYHLLIALLEKQGIQSTDWKHNFVLAEFAKEYVNKRKIFPRDVLATLYDIRYERNGSDYNVSTVTRKKAKRIFDKTSSLWNTMIKEVQNEKRQGT